MQLPWRELLLKDQANLKHTDQTFYDHRLAKQLQIITLYLRAWLLVWGVCTDKLHFGLICQKDIFQKSCVFSQSKLGFHDLRHTQSCQRMISPYQASVDLLQSYRLIWLWSLHNQAQEAALLRSEPKTISTFSTNCHGVLSQDADQ